MNEIRKQKVESLIVSEISELVRRGLKDPRVKPHTITGVQLSDDGSYATIQLILFGGRDHQKTEEDAKIMKECLEGLNAASGYIRHHLKKSLSLKHVPNLSFKSDEGFGNAFRVNEILKLI